MKSDVVSGLASAAWPVFLVDKTGMIQGANPAAIQAFGPALANGSASLASIWRSENDVSPEVFLTRWESSPSAVIALKLLRSDGTSLAHQTSICALTDDGQKY